MAMEIRRLTDASRTAPLGGRATPIAQPQQPPDREPGGQAGDRYEGAAPPEADVPFWLVAMSTDRLARRQYLSERERGAIAKLEPAWVKQLAAACRPVAGAWAAGLNGTPAIAQWQALASGICQVVGVPAPRVVWQPSLSTGRGQFLFRVEGNLLQLKPGAKGTLAEWMATVAHETFHHVQQELVCALYRGEPVGAAPLDRLAAYYRDARNVYEPVGPQCPPERHKRQALEVGAWAFGEALAQRG